MMKHTAKNWILISFLNLLIVAIVGTILRYKIAFSLPFINQKYLLHAHSHFAFSGWITMALMALMVEYLKKNQNSNAFKKYKSVLWLNLLAAYGKFVSFVLYVY